MRTFSHSSKNTYLTCPRQYDLQYNKKVIPYQETEATIWGSRVHEALELYCRDGTPLTKEFLPFKKWADKILSLPGEKHYECNLALSRGLTPTNFDDPTAWCRAVLDVMIVDGGRAATFDYKSGKIRTDTDQLKLSAAMIFQHYPEVLTVKTAYVWLKFGKTTLRTYHRHELPTLWRYFMAQAAKMETSYEKDKWVPKPSGLCNGWCGAGPAHCEFWSPKLF